MSALLRIFLAAALACSLALPLAAAQVQSARARHASPLPLSPGQVQRAQPGDADHTLRAMRDEMARSRQRLHIEGLDRPYFIEYRLLDVDVRTVTASFGALVSSTTSRNRYMSVDVRVGDYQLDSSQFVADDSFQGFLGTTGTVGIDRDYESLRQDLWLSTDQAYKQALDRLARKRAYIANLARVPAVPDFSRAEPVVLLNPRQEPDWTARDWEAEARQASRALRAFPELYGTRVTYHLVFITTYLMNSEGTEVRSSQSVAAVEAAVDTQSDDTGMMLHNFYTAYARTPAELPPAGEVAAALERTARTIVALRSSPLAEDYIGPVLFEPEAAAALLAQMLAPSLSGARPPLSQLPFFDQWMERMGGRSEWQTRMGTRVLPASVTLVDDPTAARALGRPLLGSYEVDAEGLPAERVVIVEDGILRNLLMSRRPGEHFRKSNGHARSTFLSEPRPMPSNLFFESSEAESPEMLRRKFFELCRAEGRDWCLVVKRMDNPVLAALRPGEGFELLASLAGGTGDRLPLLVYRAHVSDGREELVRGPRLTGLNLRTLRNVAGIGNDPAVFHYFQNVAVGMAGTVLGAFGSAQGGLPSSMVAPSLLLEEVEVRGARGEPRRPPVVPPPPLN